MKDKDFEDKFIAKLTKDFLKKVQEHADKLDSESRELERKYYSRHDWPKDKNLQSEEQIIQSLINLRDDLYAKNRGNLIRLSINQCLFRKYK